MRKSYYLLAFALMLSGCDSLTKPTTPKGVYKLTGPPVKFHTFSQFEVTDTKFIASFLGELAMPYTVEDGYLYAGPEGEQFRFKIISPDTLRNEGNIGMEGTYVRVTQ